MTFSPSALQTLVNDNWPGNIRALRHAIERAVILCDNHIFEAHDFQTQTDKSSDTTRVDNNGEEELNLEQLEQRTIQRALQKHHYNISHAARELGLTRAALYRRMEKFNL